MFIVKKILHRKNGYYVSNEGTKEKPSFHVWIPGVTSADCDSAYEDLSVAVSRCDYLEREKIKMPYQGFELVDTFLLEEE